MNHYPHHVGDYDSATAHLDWLEDMAYTRLLRLYYRAERPIPADIKEACRLVRARGRECKAVETVLSEFFSLQEDGWHNKRADEELAVYRDKASKASASAKTRWAQTDRYANAPPKAMRSHSDGNANQNQNQNQDKPRAFALPDWVSPEVWSQFEDHRRKLRKPMTDRARQLVILELEKLGRGGNNPQTVLEQSIRKGWQDVFPLPEGASGSPLKVASA